MGMLHVKLDRVPKFLYHSRWRKSTWPAKVHLENEGAKRDGEA